MKKIFLMTMLAIIMAACNSETPEMPGNNNGNENGNQTENPDGIKNDPSMGDIIELHKAIADALGNKPSSVKIDLTDYVKELNYVQSSYDNYKYTIEFKDGTVSVLDLNNYKSQVENRSYIGNRGNVSGRSEENNDSTFSNAKVLIWEPAPFGSVINEMSDKILTDYVGEENVIRVSGPGCTWQSLMEMSEYAMVIINGLGMDGKWIVTGQEYTDVLDYSSIKEYIGIYSAIVDGKLKNYYMVNDNFITRCIAKVNERGVIFNASASGANSNWLAEAFEKVGYPFYIGLDNMPDKNWATVKTQQFLTSMFVERLGTGDAFKTIEGIYEYKDQYDNNIKVGFKMKGNGSLYCPYTALTDRMAVLSILENYRCGSFTFDELIKDNKIVLDYNKRVNMLDLGSMGLKGSICRQLAWLDQLYMLNLNDNALCGEIPAFMGEYTHLTSLMLNNNELTGNIPDTFKDYYDNDAFINLSNNKMNGKIPFGKYTDNKTFFRFDHKYQYDYDGAVITKDHGLWFSDEPIQ